MSSPLLARAETVRTYVVKPNDTTRALPSPGNSGRKKNHLHALDTDPDFPLRTYCYNPSANQHQPPHYHAYFEIMQVYSKEALVRIGSRIFHLGRGDLFVTGGEETHSILTGSTPLRAISICFMPDLILRHGFNDVDYEYISFFYDQRFTRKNHIAAGSIDWMRIRHLIIAIHSLVRRKDRHYKIRAKNGILELLYLLLCHYETLGASVPANRLAYRRTDLMRLHAVFSMVEERYNERIFLADAAYAVGMSKSHFSRFFKRTTGYSFFKYLSNVRISKAQKLLLNNDLNCTQVAYQVGFESLSRFYRAFKELTHCTPKKFVQQIRQTPHSLVC